VAYDIFVSYAHVDDEPLPPATEGWVTTLAKSLQIRIAQKLGRREAFSLWMDHRLSGNEPLTPQIMDRIGEAATMLIIYSPGYLASEWCNREKNEFLRVAGELGSRLFVVERDRAERIAELSSVRGYRFWVKDELSDETRTLGDPVPTPDERLYYAALGDLATDMARELKERRAGPSTAAAAAPADGDTTVFLAEVTDDLDPVREEIRRYLAQMHIRVLPDAAVYTRTSAGAFIQEVDRDLQSCKLFVQLLSAIAGKRPTDGQQTFVALQCERASQAGKPILQWRDPALDLKTIADKAQSALLQGETVLAVGLEELKSEIASRARTRTPAQTNDRPTGLVFINAEQNDLLLTEQLKQIITQNGGGYVLPLQAGDPAAVRSDLEQNLLDCDMLMIVYGATTPTWVREQLRYARKVLPRRDHELQGLAVYHGPPPPKAPIGFELPAQLTIDGSGGINEQQLRAFLAKAPRAVT